MFNEVPDNEWRESLDPLLRFEAYRSSQRTAGCATAAKHFSAGNSDYGNMLVLVGLRGMHKKHLLHAACHEWISCTSASAALTTAPAWFKAFVRSIRLGGVVQFMADVLDESLLVLDGLQLFAGKERTQETLSRLLRQRLVLGRPVLIAAEAKPCEIANLSQELLDLLATGVEVSP